MFKQHGFNLIELMISIVISAAVFGVLMQIYLSTKSSNQLTAALNAIQSNAGAGMAFLYADIALAGYIGCARLSQDFPLHNTSSYALVPAINSALNRITVRHAEFPGVSVVKTVKDRAAIYTTDNIHFKAGDIVVIADCKHAEIMRIAQVSVRNDLQKILFTQPLHYAFDNAAEMGRLVINQYYTAYTNRRDARGQLISALYLLDITGRRIELVEGIASLQTTLYRHAVGIDFVAHSDTLQKPWHMFAAI